MGIASSLPRASSVSSHDLGRPCWTAQFIVGYCFAALLLIPRSTSEGRRYTHLLRSSRRTSCTAWCSSELAILKISLTSALKHRRQVPLIGMQAGLSRKAGRSARGKWEQIGQRRSGKQVSKIYRRSARLIMLRPKKLEEIDGGVISSFGPSPGDK